MLTKKQYELLLYIDKHLRDHGISPSYDEMKDALGLRSKSGIHRLMTGLEERGFIKRLPHRARALEVLRLPENQTPRASEEPASNVRAFAPQLVRNRVDLLGQPTPQGVSSVGLPFYGKIAAGTPIEALRDHNRSIDIPAALLGKGEHYALEVEGDSMIDAGILNGDIAIVQRTENAESGTIIVALVDGGEVTLKRFRRRGKSIALEPANPAYETRICGPDQVKVQGRLVALLRRY